MRNVVFAVPFALETTLRFVRAAAELADVRLILLSQEPLERFPDDLHPMLAGHIRVDDALDAQQIVAAVRRVAPQVGGRIDGLIGILEQLQVPLARAREELGIEGLSLEAARNFRDKARMKSVLRAHGLPCAAHALAQTSEEAVRAAKQIGFPLVVKPRAGAGAKGTFRIEHIEELEAYLRGWPVPTGEKILLEQFMTGKEHSFDTVSIAGRHVLHSICEYYPTPLQVMQQPWLQWCVVLPRAIDTPEFAAIHEVGPRALDVLGMKTGLTHMEWFRRPDGGVAISEVAARPPGAQFTSLMSWAHDCDFYQAWARLVTTGQFEVPERRFAVGAAFLRGQGDGHVKTVHGIEALRAELGSLVVEARLPRIGQPRASSYEGEGYVILRDETTQRVLDGLDRVLELIRVEIA